MVGPPLDDRPDDERLHFADRSRPGVSARVAPEGARSQCTGFRRRGATSDGDRRPKKGAAYGAEKCRKWCQTPRIESVAACIRLHRKGSPTPANGSARKRKKPREKRGFLRCFASNGTAERVGFEPTVELPPHWFSRPAQSAALSPLRILLLRRVSCISAVRPATCQNGERQKTQNGIRGIPKRETERSPQTLHRAAGQWPKCFTRPGGRRKTDDFGTDRDGALTKYLMERQEWQAVTVHAPTTPGCERLRGR
jgi:hypothetical protein